jgi:hypothetical protein
VEQRFPIVHSGSAPVQTALSIQESNQRPERISSGAGILFCRRSCAAPIARTLDQLRAHAAIRAMAGPAGVRTCRVACIDRDPEDDCDNRTNSNPPVNDLLEK